MIKKCLFCDKEFKVCPSAIKRGWGKYCSHKCSSNGRIGTKQSEKTREKIRNMAIKLNFGKNLIHGKLEKCPNWRGGKYVNDAGYIFIFRPGFPDSDMRGYIREHRFVAELCLGRYLKIEEIVHHINGNKTDNKPENLYLFSSKKEHSKFHKNSTNLISNISRPDTINLPSAD